MEVPDDLEFENEHVRETTEGKSMIRLVMPCPLSKAYVGAAHACGCSTD